MSTNKKGRKRRILFISAIRSEYDILYSVMRAVDSHPKTEANLIIAGAHLAQMYGKTADLITHDGFRIVGHFETLLNSDTAAGRAKSLAIELMAVVDVVDFTRPDIVVAMGDREDALTIAVAGAYMNIPVAHIGGGDHADDGNIDNSVRHAVTKLSHIHLVTTSRSGQRVINMGEEPWRVNVVGAPGLDRMLTTPILSKRDLSDYLNFDISHDTFILIIQHSISCEIEQAGQQMRTTLEAVSGLRIPALVSYPNSDAGSQRIIEVINDFSVRYPFIKPYRNLPRDIFVNLMRNAGALIGNSSCGIIEAPLLKLPVVNIGARQRDREQADNVIFVDHDASEIGRALQMALHDDSFKKRVENCLNPHGDGHSGERIAQILADVSIDRKLVAKKITY
jgi:GDP/UDP-N,N'-diacetylbacillosamine 2-epimerase (hydrolysing)